MELFIGRNDELNTFARVLSRPPALRVFHVWGDGGIGKTKLLLQAWMHYCQGTKVPTDPMHLVDLYEVWYHRITTVESKIAEWYAGKHFAEYTKLLRQYTAEREAGFFPEELAYYRAQITEAFCRCLVKASSKSQVPLLILFDTFEVVEDSDVGYWIVHEFLPNITNGNIIVAIAGRHEIDFEVLPETAYIESLHLGPFSESETREYFARRRIDGLTDAQALRLHELTLGQPVLVALASDWLLEGAGFLDLERLDPGHPSAWTQQEFENILVRKILELTRSEDQAIPLMAHIRLRFDKDVLAFLTNMLPNECQQVVENLARFSFVKYRPLSGSCLLHDEMQVLVERHIWEAIDPDRQTRRNLSRQILDYYNELLSETSDPREKQTLQAERLYYELDADLEQGFANFIDIFDVALKNYELGFCELALGQAAKYRRSLPEASQVQLGLRRARLRTRQERKSEAESILLALLEQHLGLKGKAKVLGDLGANAFYRSDFINAERYYQQAMVICERLGDEPSIGDIHNQLGLCYRGLGELENASESFRKALSVRKKYGRREGVAATLTNWSFVYRHLGNLGLALGYAKLGLAIRQAIDTSVLRERGHRHRELAYSHQVLGIIYREAGYSNEAVHHFQEAMDIAESVGHRYMEGLTQANLGYVYYLREDFAKSEGYLKKAERVLRDIDHESGLSNILSKLGRVYRKDQVTWPQAKESFHEGLGLAEHSGDAYYAIDNLVNVCKLEQREGLLDDEKIAAYRQKLDELLRGRYHFPLLVGVFENVIGLYESERGDYEAASQHYALEYQYMSQYGRLNKRVFDSIDRLTDRILSLPSERVSAFCSTILEQWAQWEGDPEAEEIISICRMAQDISKFLEG